VLTLNRKAPPSFSAGDVDRAGLLASEIVLALENTRALRAVVGAEKLATIGQVAASIVHEINNPLACVLANVEAAQTRVTRILEHPGWYEADAPAAPQALAEVQQMLAEARDAGVRIKEIIRDMRSLTSGDAAATIFDVGEAVGSAVRIAGGSLRKRATLDIEPGRGLKTVGSASQLSQVLLNLLINAGDALAETPRRDPRISVRAWRDDKSVLIAIADNGPGMSPGVAARAFEPFFTTKARSGTGLGLSISRDIVRRYGGEIRLNTNPGVGSEFVVVLPSAEVTARE
jgi:signal transduction histidine kinase